MKYLNQHIVPILLGSLLLLLVASVPGGLFDHRDYSHIDADMLLTFNILLTVLGIGTVILMGFTYYKFAWASLLSSIVGFSFVVIYLLDLLGIFPSTPTPISDTLFFIVVLGMLTWHFTDDLCLG